MAPKIGDVVRLKSGGPDMTVQGVGEEDVFCVWFDGKKAQDKLFHKGVLTEGGPTKMNIAFLDETDKEL